MVEMIFTRYPYIIFFCLIYREAAENVGCNILRVISEPAAALLAYGKWKCAL